MSKSDLVEQQRTIIQTFRQITEERSRTEVTEDARFQADQSAADATLNKARSDAQAQRLAAEADAQHRRTTERQAADTALEHLRKAAAANMATVDVALKNAHEQLARAGADTMLHEAHAQPLRATAPGDARTEMARSTVTARDTANVLPDLIDALLQARQRSSSLRGLLVIALTAVVIAAIVLISALRERQAERSVVAAQATAIAISNSTATAEAVGASATATAMAPVLTSLQDRSGMEMVYVPPGEFLMGSPDGAGAGDEHPQHKVYLSAYWIDRTEVTADQYRRCVEAGECMATASGSPCTYADAASTDHPVNCVDWNQAAAYCAWADKRLPTEAEWEKVARGADGRTYPWGEDAPDCGKAQYSGCEGHTVPVGSLPEGASPYGVFDMAGNVREWVADWYEAGYYSYSPIGNPSGPETGSLRVLRGGSWNDGGVDVRTATRLRYAPGDRNDFVGFRCARSS